MELLVFLALIVIYFVPTIVAGRRQHNSWWAIALVNIALGWTLLGWFIAMVWSLTGNVRRELNEARVKCPHCAELVLKEAKVCKHCGRDLAPVREASPS
jgi:hypothetical protein